MSVEIPSLLGNCNYHLMREINTGKENTQTQSYLYINIYKKTFTMKKKYFKKARKQQVINKIFRFV